MDGATDDPVRGGPEAVGKEPRLVDNDQAHLIPSWIWFASSAFPMIAGTLGPVASAFSICALVRPWRQHLPPGTDIQDAQYTRDPAWLTAVNAVQLVIALVANAALLLNMTRRVRFTVAQPLTIVGWYVSSLCLVCLSATAAGPLRLHAAPAHDTHVWSQAFYYGIYAAVLYFIVASLMAANVLGAHAGYYAKDFLLSTSQRTLMLQTITFLAYLLLGALVFSTIEGWSYLDGLYWADVSLFTVGFGDLSVQTPLGRALFFPYALVGVISLGLVIDAIRRLILDRGRRRMDARTFETRRQAQLRRLARDGRSDLLEPVRPVNAGSLTEFERRREEFRLMRQIQRRAARRRRWRALAMSTSTWLVLWLVGARIFQACEEPYQHWSYFDAFYLCFVSLTTIGYGDVTPVSNSGRSFFVFWSLMALPTMTVLISHAGDTVVKWVRDATNQLGSVTILPGDKSFRDALKTVLHTLSCGKFCQDAGDLFSPSPSSSSSFADPDSVGAGEEMEARRQLEEQEQEERVKQGRAGHDPEKCESHPPADAPSTSAPQDSATSNRRPCRRSVSVMRESLAAGAPASRSGHHLALIQEISRLVGHLRQDPPRQYRFPQWAWYLRLMGEDEDDAERHRKPIAASGDNRKHKVRNLPHRKAEATTSPDAAGEDDEFDGEPPWSWLGSRSPLMGSQEEAEWILERLIHKLLGELRQVAEEEKASKGGG